MKKVCIGIYVHAEPQSLKETLDSLRAHTQVPHELMLLPDGADYATSRFIATLDIPQLATSQPKGTAACFNRLAKTSDAEVGVLLESGARVGPGWLDHLLKALYDDPRNGIVGPSTNNSWNEQCVCPGAAGTNEAITQTASEVAERYSDQIRSLAPLYSLSDFCYVVRREVIEIIGAADEGYSLGPCWEMDYNARAERAGWRSIWACAAYVHRAPFTARRRFEEGRRFSASKRIYQDKFCGARLRREKTDYREHCRGDACPNFAPPSLIDVHLPFSLKREATRTIPIQSISVSEPLVTCIMPTFNRRAYIPQAIRCFLRQDYPNLELLVVDDGTDPIDDCVPQNDRVRYLRLDNKLRIGAKRNFACDQARGEFIVHWDDDDWYPRRRVSEQINAMVERGAELSGTSRLYYYDGLSTQAWEYRYPTSSAPWVGGNTLAFRKRHWQQHRFPDIQIGEDSRFVWASAGSSICDLSDPSLCVAAVHAGNTSRKDVTGSCWHAQPSEVVETLLGDDINFYRTATLADESPLVSCIMPTHNRRQYVPHALQSFLKQDYPNRELIVVDDGSDSIADLVGEIPNLQYIRVARTSIGAKRNLACGHARGEIIAHWDDDDWYSPDRLRYQVAPLLRGADLTGLENSYVLQLPAGQFWTTQPALHKRLFVENVHGGTLVYRKELLAQGLRYPEINLAEDAWLVHNAVRRGKKLVRLENPGVFVYVRHGGNAWREFAPGRFIDPSGWEKIPMPLHFPAAAMEFYQHAAST
ncbi:MAG TPA: glycosyltransferase [Pyrinomonadaceae bacterium]|nr:glycosyltransferase [Pyrinomonadaceae bacterium]